MTKAKKDFVSWIIWLVVGVLFTVAGIIMTTITKNNKTVWIVCGSIMAACGVAIIIISIIKLIKSNKIYQQEKAR